MENKDVKEFKSIGHLRSIALLKPQGSDMWVWRYRREITVRIDIFTDRQSLQDEDFPESSFSNIVDFEKYILEEFKK